MTSHTDDLFLHADGDSFFVACELTLRPDLRGRPVVVGEDKGIAVAMSTEAKKLGVTRGMPTFQIKKLYPEVVMLSHHFYLYREISEKMHQILLSYADVIEVYSIDECFAWVRPAEIKYFGDEKKFVAELKSEIEKTLGVTYSFGLARTKALAKQASKLEKPAGSVILLSKADEARALERTPIDDIWGIGKKTVPDLERLGIKTANDFVKYKREEIARKFSRPVVDLHKELSGESVLMVENDINPRDQKSIQSTSTFRPSSDDPKIIWREISENTEHACEHARVLHLVSDKISFFVKTSEFKYHFGEIKLDLYTSDPGIILNAMEEQFQKILPKGQKIRSTGVILHNLVREENIPMDLFGNQEKSLKKSAVEDVADKIREKFGNNSIIRATSLKKKKNE